MGMRGHCHIASFELGNFGVEFNGVRFCLLIALFPMDSSKMILRVAKFFRFFSAHSSAAQTKPAERKCFKSNKIELGVSIRMSMARRGNEKKKCIRCEHSAAEQTCNSPLEQLFKATSKWNHRTVTMESSKMSRCCTGTQGRKKAKHRGPSLVFKPLIFLLAKWAKKECKGSHD